MHLNKFSESNSLIIATGNAGKLKEFSGFLEEFSFKIIPQPDGYKVEEIGQTFVENARIKAIAASVSSDQLSLADDSGLCVEALNGAPGIHSARYAKTDTERINKLLKELEPFTNRKATFNSAICIASKGEVLIEVEGKCEGLITYKPRGDYGFGYDPIFEVLDVGLTFAEMGLGEKKIYGHRGIAFKILLPKLKELLEFS